MLSILPKRRAPTILETGGSSEVCRASERKMVVELSQLEGVKEMGDSGQREIIRGEPWESWRGFCSQQSKLGSQSIPHEATCHYGATVGGVQGLWEFSSVLVSL